MDINYTRPKLYPEQEAAIFNNARISVTEGSTKSGKSLGVMVWLFEQAINSNPGDLWWWMAPVHSQAEQIGFEGMQQWLPSMRHLLKINKTSQSITLPNGAIIRFVSAEKPDNLYGRNVRGMVIDEFTRCDVAAWIAAQSVLTATNGPVRLIGNVVGKRNWGYRLARTAEQYMRDNPNAPNPLYHYAKLTAIDAVEAGVIDIETLMAAKRNMPDSEFRMLYLCEPPDDGGNPFGIDAINDCIVPAVPQHPFICSTEPAVVYGIDPAKQHDYTVVIGLDEDGNVCNFDRYQENYKQCRARIHTRVERTPTLIDATGIGDVLTDFLDDDEHNIKPYKISTYEKRQELLENLAIAIQRQEVHFPDGPIAQELMDFVYDTTREGKIRYTSQGDHDDCVFALALAVMKKRRRRPAILVPAGRGGHKEAFGL